MSGHGTFYWNELMTRDPAKAKEFYGTTLGWTFDDMPMGDGLTYYVAKQGEAMVGGIMTMGPEMQGVPEHWFTYVEVDDVAARLEKLKAAGGTVMREPFEVPGIGLIAIIQDPGGAMQGWMKPTS